MRARVVAWLAAGVLAASVAACRPGTVTITFRPKPGAHYRYHVVVRTKGRLEISGQDPKRTDATVELETDQVVRRVASNGTTLGVTLRFAEGGVANVVVHLDPNAQLLGIDADPGSSLGDLGLAEVFPAAVGSPPHHPLRPGEEWTLADAVELPDSVPTRLSAHGRLAHLGIDRGVRTATVETAIDLPIVRTTTGADGRQSVLEGTQHTHLRTTQALADGAVQTATATTTATYSLRLLPPAGVDAEPLPGELTLTVESTTTRIG